MSILDYHVLHTSELSNHLFQGNQVTLWMRIRNVIQIITSLEVTQHCP